jgi:3-hydroxyisobutyrate dehydrogenase-like beta-hydroxyacid dehydrogenase
MAAGEGMLLGAKAGVDPQKLYEIVQASSGASWAMNQFPQKVFAGDFTPGFMIDLAYKDLRLALDMGDECSVPLVLGSVCINLMRQMRANGRGGDDLSGLIRTLEDAIDFHIRPPRGM